MDWKDCPLVESVPGRVNGAPVLKNTRMPVETIIDNIEYGMSPEEVAEVWRVPLESVLGVYHFYLRHHAGEESVQFVELPHTKSH